MRRVVILAVLVGCGDDGAVSSASSTSEASTSTTTTTTTSTSTTTSTTTSTSTSSSGEGTTFGDESGYEDDGLLTGCAFTCPNLPPGGGGGGPGGGFECNPVTQDCPEGEKCMPWANDGGDRWNATRCSPLSPQPFQPGEACTVEGSGFSGVDDCDLGVMCWRVDPKTNTGTCHQLCGTIPGESTCPDGFVCSQPYGYGLRICVTPCDPLAQDCPPGEGCYPAGLAFGCLPTLDAIVPDGDVCEYRTECVPGSFCADAADLETCAGERCCTRLCDATTLASCDSCTPYFPEAITSAVGFCP
jgi:hypothetical protein